MEQNEPIINAMNGRRAIIGFISANGRMEMTIGIIHGGDSDFIKIKSIPENAQQGIIEEGLISYIPTRNIDSIIDAQDEKVYQMVLKNLQAKQAAAQAQMKAQAETAKAAQEEAGNQEEPPTE